MTEQLSAAAEVMGVPEPIVARSARAWAEAAGSTYEEVLTGWAGGQAVATAAPAAAPAPADVPEEPSVDDEAPSPESAPAAVPSPTTPAQPAPAPVAAAVQVAEPEVAVDPMPLGERVRLGGRIGAWTGATLGLLGLVMGSTWLLAASSLTGEEGAFEPAVEVTTSRLVLAVVLMSVVFGIVVAALSRALAGWVDRAAQLQGRWATTILMGAGLGLALGAGAGAVMVSAFSTPVEGAEGIGLISVVPMAIEVLLGGAFLGWLTAALVQVVGVPAAIGDESAEEIADVRGRLSSAVSIPVGALSLLALLVLPLGLIFIRSNEMAGGGAAVLAIFAAASILGIAALGTSRPTMKMGWGEMAVAAFGIVTVVVIVVAVIYSRAAPEVEEEGATETTVAEQVEDTTPIEAP